MAMKPRKKPVKKMRGGGMAKAPVKKMRGGGVAKNKKKK